MCTKYTLFTQICCNNFGVPAYNARCTLDGYSFRVIRLFFFSKVLCTKNDTLFLESISHTLVNMKPPIHFSKHCKRIKKTDTGSWNMENIQTPSARRLKTIFFQKHGCYNSYVEYMFGIFQLWTQWFVSWKRDKYPRMGKTLNLFLYTNIASYFLCIHGHFIFFGTKSRYCWNAPNFTQFKKNPKRHRSLRKSIIHILN